MTADNTARTSLKTKLIRRLAALSLQQAIFPQPEPAIDKIIGELEELNPIPQPLNLDNQTLISGSWQLIYASNGTVVTRQVATIPDWTGFKIKQVYQTIELQITPKLQLLTVPKSNYLYWVNGKSKLREFGNVRKIKKLL